jgi:hypothetical protein
MHTDKSLTLMRSRPVGRGCRSSATTTGRRTVDLCLTRVWRQSRRRRAFSAVLRGGRRKPEAWLHFGPCTGCLFVFDYLATIINAPVVCVYSGELCLGP